MSKIARQADHRAPAATWNGLLMGTSVVTLDGDLPVEFLEIGDRILTRDGAKTLVSIEIAVLTNARMVRIEASTLDRERPEEDVLVPATQKILVRDWRAMAFAGTPQALIPASRLSDGEFIRGEILEAARIYALGFDEDVVIYAGGLELECAAVTAPV